MFLKQLCDAPGITGYEEEISHLLSERVKDHVDRFHIDPIGNLVAYKAGKGLDHDPQVLLMAHMDEVGGIVKGVTQEGYLLFSAVGDVDVRMWPAKRVRIGANQVMGVVGIRAVHLQNKAIRHENVKQEDLYIDIGTNSKEEALHLVRLGDPIVFDSNYATMGSQFLKAKGLNGRAGCSIIAELLDDEFAVSLIAAFTIQAEVGFRGAEVLSHTMDYDLAIDVCLVPCGDAFYRDLNDSDLQLGQGPVLMRSKGQNAKEVKLLHRIHRAAISAGIATQWSVFIEKECQADKLRVSRSESPVMTIGIPCRNQHSPNVIIDADDMEKCKALIHFILSYYSNLMGMEDSHA